MSQLYNVGVYFNEERRDLGLIADHYHIVAAEDEQDAVEAAYAREGQSRGVYMACLGTVEAVAR